MTKTQIYNIALSQHGKRCTESEVLAENPPYEVRLCEDGYATAVNRMLGEHDWSRYTVKVDYDPDEDEPALGYRHGYLLPEGILRIVNTGILFRLVGNRFLTDCDNPEIYAITDSFDCEDEPDDYCTLVGLALAYDLCGILAPADSAIANLIMQKYTWTSTPMISADCPPDERNIYEGGAVL